MHFKLELLAQTLQAIDNVLTLETLVGRCFASVGESGGSSGRCTVPAGSLQGSAGPTDIIGSAGTSQDAVPHIPQYVLQDGLPLYKRMRRLWRKFP